MSMLEPSQALLGNIRDKRADVTIAEITVKPGEWKTPASSNVSLALTLKPTAATKVKGNPQYLKPMPMGNISLCPLNDSRVFEFTTETAFAHITLSDALFAPLLQGSRVTKIELISRDILEDATLRKMAAVLLQQKRDCFQAGALFLDSMATALSSYLVSKYSTVSPLEAAVTGGLAPSTLRRCIDFIQANLSRSIRLDDLARESGLSTSHLVRSFRQSIGKSPYQYVLELRTQRAKLMMQEGHLGLTDIALSSGFANQHHLSRVFTKLVGITPSRYRAGLPE